MHLEIPTLSVLQREYEAHVTHRHKPRTVRHERNVSRKLARELPPHCSPGDLRSYLERRVDAGEIATSTANAYLQTAFKLYDLASQTYGVPNAWRTIKPFPPAPPRPRVVNPLPGLEAGGRRARVEWWINAACTNDVERGALFALYDSGLRIQELLAVPLGGVAADGTYHVLAQRDPHADVGELEPPKTRSSAARISFSAEGVEWIRRASLAPERARWGGNWRGREKRDRLAAAFVFPFTDRMLANLLRRLRAIDPESFPRRVVGARGGDAWHPFRHAFATDIYDATIAAGQGHDAAIGAAQIALRHKHNEWTRTYIEPLRGRDNRIDRTALEGMRRAQAAAARAALGVTTIGGGNDARDPEGRGAVAVARGAGDAARPGGDRGVDRAAVVDADGAGGADVAAPGAVKVSGVAGGNTGHLAGVPQHRAGGVGSRLCQPRIGRGSRWGSTPDTGHGNTRHDPAPAPAAQRGLPLGPLGVAKAPRTPARKRKAGAR